MNYNFLVEGKKILMDEKNICTVLLITYNYSKYLKEALESVINQKTKYKYKVSIFDDASTDGTQEIIKKYENKYPDIIKSYIAENNMGAQANIWRAFKSVDTKYFLILEGDDYWCDERKLELQINAMEKHSGCSFCGHDMYYIAYNDDTREYEDKTRICTQPILRNKSIFSFRDFRNIKDGGYIPYVSARLIRTDVLNMDKIKYKESILFDFSQFYYLLTKGKYYYIDLPMSVYRRTGEGVCSSQSALSFLNTFLQSAIDLNLETNNIIADKIFEECQLQIDFQRKRQRNSGIRIPIFNRDGTVKEKISSDSSSVNLLLKEEDFSKEYYYFLSNAGLGYTMIMCSLKESLEKKLGAKIILMVQSAHEFILHNYNIKDFIVIDTNDMDYEALSSRYPNPTKGKIFVTHPFSHKEATQYYLGILNMYSSQRYIPWVLEFFGLDKDIEINYPTKNTELDKKSIEKLKVMGDLDKVVLFLPDSYSMPKISKKRWVKEADKLNKAGYKVYSAPKNMKNTIRGTKYIKLTIEEVFYVGMRCHGVYSLRNGFCDLLKSRGDKLHVFYPSHAAQYIYTLNKAGKVEEVDEQIELELDFEQNIDERNSQLPLLFGIIRIPDSVYRFYDRHRHLFKNKKLIKFLVKWR